MPKTHRLTALLIPASVAAVAAQLLVAAAPPAQAAQAHARWQNTPADTILSRTLAARPAAAAIHTTPSVVPVQGHRLPGGTGRVSTAATTISGLTLRATSRAKTASSWPVTVASSDASDRLGVVGATVQIAPGTTAPTELTINYAALARSYGDGWASRIHATQLTGCTAVTTSAPHCTGRRDLPAHNDAARQQLTITPLPSAPSTPASATHATAVPQLMTVALTAAAAGTAGDSKATSLSRSATWQAGDSSGAFSWSYPIAVPPTEGGPTPQLSLGYSSSAVDGETASTNNQPSWVGEGFDLTNNYVERRYRGCADDGNTASGDECWFSDNASLMLNGKSSELIRDAAGNWHMKDDDGSKIEKLTGASNGDSGTAGVDGVGEYWKVTSTDGTQYIFGVNRLPGWVSGNADTNSVLTVPVFGNNTGEPCHSTVSFDAGYCQQAWRWNLDRVIDPHGNSMVYYYTKQQSAYGRDGSSTKKSVYDIGSYLASIDYGLRDGSEHGVTNPPQRVSFAVADRCVTAGTTCTNASANWSNWPDVPWDQYCNPAASVTSCSDLSPTFWTSKRLATITTQVATSATASKNVDQWTLAQSYPNPNFGSDPRTNASLWLDRIKHTGLDGTSTPVDDVVIASTPLPNRVNRTGDGLPPMNKFRISSIVSESGDVLSINYSGWHGSGSPAQDCDPAAIDSNSIVPSSNGTRCYPAWYAPYSDTKPDWFRKYVVDSIVDSPVTAGDNDVITNYQYLGNPGWALEDDAITPANKRLWNQWRGYQTVRTISGDTVENPDDQRAVSDQTFFRGLGVDVPDSQGAGHSDPPEMAGRTLETVEYSNMSSSGAIGPAMTSTIISYKDSVTATNADTKYVVGSSRFVLPETTTVRTRISTGWRTAQTVTSYNSYGLPIQIADSGDLADSTDDQCTTTLYTAPNTTKYIVDAIARTYTVAEPCGTAAVYPQDAINDTVYYYDGGAYAVAPTVGNVSSTKIVHDWDPVAQKLNYIQNTATVYDTNGRSTQVTDILGRINKTTYNTAYAGGPVTQIVTTNALNKTKTTDLEPGRGLPLDTIDENLKRTDLTYDGLGRLTAQWQTNHTKSANPSTPSYKFGYQESSTGANWTSSAVLNRDGSTYTTTYSLLDGMLRPRQTQTTQANSNTLVQDTFYNTRGLVAKTYDGYAVAGNPTSALIVKNDNEIAAQTHTVFDGLNRPTAVINAPSGQEAYRTTTVYNGDSTVTMPPAGGSATKLLLDAKGRTTQSLSYPTDTTTGTPAATSYTYLPTGKLHTVTDAGSSVWRYEYDIRGFQTDSYDPDKGHDQISYDDAGRATSNTDALGQVTATVYDALDRQTSVHQNSSTGPLLASWTYDTLAFGQLTSSSTFDTAGNEYKTAVDGYNDLYQPTGQTVTIPAVEGPLAGSYDTKNYYYGNGLLGAQDLPPVGTWTTAERVTLTYNTINQPVSLTSSQVGALVSSATYNAFGEMATMHADRGSQQAMDQTYVYDSTTRRLARTLVTQPYTSATIADQNYTYNATGDLTKQTDATSGDTQCYNYDAHKQLTDAWTPASGDCTAPADSTTLGGPAPYWQSWAYAANGARRSQTTHSVGVAGQVTESYTYPASPTAAQPHGVTGISSTGGPASTYHWDADGHMADRTGHTYQWNPLGHLASDTTTATGDVTSYLYDADGQRLIRHDAKGATLYIGDTELRWEAGSATQTRYYSFGGNTVAIRTGATDVQWLVSDPHNTAQISINANNTSQISRRYENPYGADRGAPASFAGDHGFVDGVSDPEGDVHLGAREYLPTLGQFISVDPVIDYNDPAQLNPYVYSHNDPVNGTDPTGTMVDYMGGDPTVAGSQSVTHSMTTTNNTVTVTTTVATTTSSGDVVSTTTQQTYQATPPKPKKKHFWQKVVKFLGDITGVNDIIGCIRNPSVGGCVMAAIDVVTTVMPAAKGAVVAFKTARAGMEVVRAGEELNAVAKIERAAKDTCEVANSFDPKTLVVLASGATKAIGTLKVGDQVLSSDPKSSKPAQAEPVERVIWGTGNKHLVDLTVRDNHGKTSTVVATDQHPFWVADTSTWTYAVDLHTGDQLVEPSATGVATSAVVVTVHRHVHFQQVYNLTVHDLHTYYIRTSVGTNILVHNCDVNIYEAGGKHAETAQSTSRGVNSAEPIDGQAALDNSVQVKDTSPRRVGVDKANNQYVVLDRTREVPCGCGNGSGVNSLFHGHVRSWDDLHPDMQGALQRANMADRRGRML